MILKEFARITLGLVGGVVAIYFIYSLSTVTYRLVSVWMNRTAEPIPNYVGVCISDEGDYKLQYELKDVEKLKKTCEYLGTSRDIMGCYGDDFYRFQCGTK